MTGPEREDLRILTAYVRDWRRADEDWKARAEVRWQDFDERLRDVEVYVASALATAAVAADAKLSRRAKVAALIGGAGVFVSLLVGVLNLLT